MPHVSKHELGEVVYERLFEQLFKMIERASDKRAIKYLGSELFTRTEKIMLAKRLAIILLLDRGVPQHAISSQLHISPSTVAKTSLKLDRGKYKTIRKLSGGWLDDILETLENFLLIGMYPRIGKGKWGKWKR
jgi:Trp operon repressor